MIGWEVVNLNKFFIKIKGWIEDKKYNRISLVVMGIIILFPTIIHIFAYLWSLQGIGIGSIEGWLSFWGSYLGGISGAIGVIFTTYWIINTQNKKEKRDYKNQLELTQFNLSQEVKIKQINDKINALQNLIINVEKYYMYTVRLTEYYNLYIIQDANRSIAKEQGKIKEWEIADKGFYRAIDLYNNFLDQKAGVEQIVYIELYKVIAISGFFKNDKSTFESLYKEIETNFGEYSKLIDDGSFEVLTLERIGDNELYFSGKLKEKLKETFIELECILNDSKDISITD